MLITFEGIDGCGKSTQAALLAERLRKENIEILLLREPGGTELSEQVRSILLQKEFTHPLTAEAELLLFAASRAQLVHDVILPALSRMAIVILDRFTDSTVAYQGFGRGIPLSHITHINTLAAAELEPDLTFLLDIPLELALNRRKGTMNDRIESENEFFYAHVLQGYMYQANLHSDRINVLNGDDSIEEIHHAIWRLVEYERGNDIRHANHISE
jgi:dTMP kinase